MGRLIAFINRPPVVFASESETRNSGRLGRFVTKFPNDSHKYLSDRTEFFLKNTIYYFHLRMCIWSAGYFLLTSDQVIYWLFGSLILSDFRNGDFENLWFQAEVQKAPVSGNLDGPEGGFDAIMQAVVCHVRYNRLPRCDWLKSASLVSDWLETKIAEIRLAGI